ncbi:DEAD/DEAH box helicase, partial [Acidimicrobium ferrooxidans]|nr:DEAD/DEAH box helicase [Acidimicrobium ferrooxidans]
MTLPDTDFTRFDLGRALQRGIAEAGFTTPRSIQAQTIPAVLEGRDVMGLAQTGTGKTAAFGLPILERLLRNGAPGPRVLIVAPTRELANQIAGELRQLGRHTRIQVVTVFGGVSDKPQIAALKRNPEIIVACPGRLLDLHRQRLVRLDRVETLVLDEADHLFDMGFMPDVRRIMAALPAVRQNLMFSATMPTAIRGLASDVLHDPHIVEIAHSAPAKTVSHALYPVPAEHKQALLIHLIESPELTSAIVFTRTKHRAKRLAKKLERLGHRAVALQGNMSQSQRDRAMSGFRAGDFDILVATDIAARGIDVAGISHVINFDLPDTPDAYTHRIGRTGRAELDGQACSLVTEEDLENVRVLERTLNMTIPRQQIPGFEGVRIPDRRSSQRSSVGGRGRPRSRG